MFNVGQGQGRGPVPKSGKEYVNKGTFREGPEQSRIVTLSALEAPQDTVVVLPFYGKG
jgi:hypothetical protein